MEDWVRRTHIAMQHKRMGAMRRSHAKERILAPGT
jgi:hypothetical protein